MSIPSVAFARKLVPVEPLAARYPSIEDAVVSSVVGASHSNLERVKALVGPRPELARATWDWAYGDWETAIGAASHTGRRDIANYLMSQGARPDMFTYAMLGDLPAVKAMIEATPGAQAIAGPHGISLLQHARNGLRTTEGAEQESKSKQLIDYLESLGNANPETPNLDLSEVDQTQLLGDYKYGQGEADGFSVRLNLRKMLSLGRLGTFGGALFHAGNHVFVYNGCPSVKVSFQLEAGSLTVEEPGLTLVAKKV